MKSPIHIGGHSIRTYFEIAEPAKFEEGAHILRLTGNPVGDAWFHSQKAVQSPTHDNMVKYIRQSKEALSQYINTNNMRIEYESLYEKIEKVLKSESIAHNQQKISTAQFADDFKKVKEISETELNSSNLSGKEKESYNYIKDVAEREIKKIGTSKKYTPVHTNVSKPEQTIKTKNELENKTTLQADKVTDEVIEDDDEIKKLRRRLRNLQITLIELKRTQENL